MMHAETTVTPGWKTTEFWVTLLTIVAAIASMAEGYLPAEWGVAATAVSSGAYAIGRALSKTGGAGARANESLRQQVLAALAAAAAAGTGSAGAAGYGSGAGSGAGGVSTGVSPGGNGQITGHLG